MATLSVRNVFAAGLGAITGLALVGFVGCGDDQPTRAQRNLQTAAATRSALGTAPACSSGTGPHDKHAFSSYGCALCHPCGGVYAFESVTLPGGTNPGGGQLTRSTATTPASCVVACHNMNGGNQPITWVTPASPLACSSCHLQGSTQAGTPTSTHFAASTTATDNRTACQSCHVMSQHLSGQVYLQGPSGVLAFTRDDPSQVNPVCIDCHDGTGRTLLGQTPPLLVGYSDPSGDFHGIRAGTGWGGTLATSPTPYVRGQGPLPCEACHDAHSSTNAFLFASTVEGQAVASNWITRAGVGAEALCQKCHLGDFHAGCKASNCHDNVMAPSALVPMSGQPCFFCHGHEGIVNIKIPTWNNHPNATGDYCGHCHSPGWYPTTVVTTPPTVTNVTVTGVTQSSATISWTTNVPATTYLEIGTTDATNVVGDGTLTTQHSYQLTGLTANTTYVYRVRSSDAFRNVALVPAAPSTSNFATPAAGVPAAPALVAVPDQAYQYYTPSFSVTLQWSAVSLATSYHVVVWTSTQTVLDTTVTGTSIPLTEPLPNGLYSDGVVDHYYWHVSAIGAGGASAWSATDAFDAYQWMMM